MTNQKMFLHYRGSRAWNERNSKSHFSYHQRYVRNHKKSSFTFTRTKSFSLSMIHFLKKRKLKKNGRASRFKKKGKNENAFFPRGNKKSNSNLWISTWQKKRCFIFRRVTLCFFLGKMSKNELRQKISRQMPWKQWKIRHPENLKPSEKFHQGHWRFRAKNGSTSNTLKTVSNAVCCGEKKWTKKSLPKTSSYVLIIRFLLFLAFIIQE